MSTSISFPADAVVAGATEIQTTNFALVAADYQSVEYRAVSLFASRIPGVKLDYLPKFANGVATPDWTFFMRKDLAGTNAMYRNLIGVKVVTSNTSVSGYSPSVAKVVSLPIQSHRIEVYNWHPAAVTLTDGTVFARWGVNIAAYVFYVDPESGQLLYGDGSHRSLYEAVNFLLTPVAANKPSASPALALVTGISPL